VKGASSESSPTLSEGEEGRQGAEGGAQEGGDVDVVYEVPQYTGAVHYKVPKTGYYCVGMSSFLASSSNPYF